MPLLGDTLQSAHPRVGEPDPAARHEILHRARYEHLAGAGGGRHPGRDVDRDPGQPRLDQLTFTRVDACPDLDPK